MSSAPASPSTHLALDADQRFELASLASRDERRNRPSHWLLIATVLFFASLLALGWAGLSRARAEKSLADQRFIANATAELCGQIETLRKRSADEGDRANQPITQIRSRLQAIGAEAGIKGKIPLPVDSPEIRGNAKRMRFRFDNVQDESLPALLAWLDMAVKELPGVEVNTVTIRPLANTWQMNVTFARWERAG